MIESGLRPMIFAPFESAVRPLGPLLGALLRGPVRRGPFVAIRGLTPG
jgi:hypothetical protein